MAISVLLRRKVGVGLVPTPGVCALTRPAALQTVTAKDRINAYRNNRRSRNNYPISSQHFANGLFKFSANIAGD